MQISSYRHLATRHISTSAAADPRLYLWFVFILSKKFANVQLQFYM